MKIFKFYIDKDSEEKWINDMAKQGWAFQKFFLGFYTFVPCEPGEYIYQIDLLDNWAGDKENFSSFMEELGVEVICQWYRWIYLRKLASDGSFEMYTDASSKIRQYQRIMNFFIVGALLESLCLLVELNAFLRLKSPLFFFLCLLIVMIVFAFIQLIIKCRYKIQELKKIS